MRRSRVALRVGAPGRGPAAASSPRPGRLRVGRCLLLLALAGCAERAEERRVLVFLHNRFVELAGPAGVHEEYGPVEYDAILARFRRAGFDVRSEVRPADTDVEAYAARVAEDVRGLIRSGVPASHVTIVGTSKGGFIARRAASLLGLADVGVVLVGCCGADDAEAGPAVDVCGRILSIYEETDALGRSCATLRERSRGAVSRYAEIVLHTGLRHGFLYKALDAWIDPAIAWARE